MNNNNQIKEKSPQFKRTDSAIIKAMIALLERKTFEQITVQDILDETPVSRGTFYAHYEDKYQLAKSMLDMYMEFYQQAPQEYVYTRKDDYASLSRRMVLQNYQLANALMKIHTDQVDLRSTLAKQIESEYIASIQEDLTEKNLAASSSENKQSSTIKKLHPQIEDEAQIYAQAMVALQMNYMHRAYANDIDNYYVDRVVTSALLHFLRLDNDLETRSFLTKKLEEMEKHRPVK